MNNGVVAWIGIGVFFFVFFGLFYRSDKDWKNDDE